MRRATTKEEIRGKAEEIHGMKWSYNSWWTATWYVLYRVSGGYLSRHWCVILCLPNVLEYMIRVIYQQVKVNCSLHGVFWTSSSSFAALPPVWHSHPSGVLPCRLLKPGGSETVDRHSITSLTSPENPVCLGEQSFPWLLQLLQCRACGCPLTVSQLRIHTSGCLLFLSNSVRGRY